MVHLVYCDDKEKVLDKILAGTKTMVIRRAAGRKIPHSRVFDGEKLYFMKKGTAKITAMATVESVQNYVKLSDEDIIKTLCKKTAEAKKDSVHNSPPVKMEKPAIKMTTGFLVFMGFSCYEQAAYSGNYSNQT